MEDHAGLFRFYKVGSTDDLENRKTAYITSGFGLPMYVEDVHDLVSKEQFPTRQRLLLEAAVLAKIKEICPKTWKFRVVDSRATEMVGVPVSFTSFNSLLEATTVANTEFLEVYRNAVEMTRRAFCQGVS